MFVADELDVNLNNKQSTVIKCNEEFAQRLTELLHSLGTAHTRNALIAGFGFLNGIREAHLQIEDVVLVEGDKKVPVGLEHDLEPDRKYGPQVWYTENGSAADRCIASLMNHFHLQSILGFSKFVFATTQMVEDHRQEASFQSDSGEPISYSGNLDEGITNTLRTIGTSSTGNLLNRINHQRFRIRNLF
ncbi:hypothetical protein KKC44_05755 [Patescibacteria group bacterium]|nr:hypothetical protein [Patescibacteria group bacterium]